MKIVQNRRTFLSVVAGAMAAPYVVAGQTPTDVDTVVIGAGAAGLAAARTLAGAGKRFVVLEARDRVGGRTYTETSSLGVPYDQGASWIHHADQNPLMDIAKEMGRQVLFSPYSDIRIFDNREEIPGAGDLIEAAESGLNRRLGWASLWRGDFAPTEIGIPDRWQRAAMDIGAFTMAVDLDSVSMNDFSTLDGGDDYVVAQGFGKLVADYSAAVPVMLGHAVKRINWAEAGRVEVSGDFGTITAGNVIITVPTPVLASGAISFDPELPYAKTQSFYDLRGGDFFKVGMRVPAIPSDIREFTFDIGRSKTGEALVFHFGRLEPVVTMIASGSSARAITALPQNELYDFARSELAHVTDRAFAGKVSAFTSHDWSRDAFAQGAFSVRRIGANTARQDYGKAVEDRLFFAGEAAGLGMAVTVGGAHNSGIHAARESIGKS